VFEDFVPRASDDSAVGSPGVYESDDQEYVWSRGHHQKDRAGVSGANKFKVVAVVVDHDDLIGHGPEAFDVDDAGRQLDPSVDDGVRIARCADFKCTRFGDCSTEPDGTGEIVIRAGDDGLSPRFDSVDEFDHRSIDGSIPRAVSDLADHPGGGCCIECSGLRYGSFAVAPFACDVRTSDRVFLAALPFADQPQSSPVFGSIDVGDNDSTSQRLDDRVVMRKLQFGF